MEDKTKQQLVEQIESLRQELAGQKQEKTDLKRAEEELRESQQNFRNSLDSSPLGIRIVTAEGELLYANQAILNIYGYSSVEELKAMPAKQRYTPESYAEHQERIKKRKLGQPVPSEYEVSVVRKDGEVRHLSASRREVIWGGKTQFQSLYQDITERKRTKERIEHLNLVLRAIRKVNQLITKEKDREKLLKGACDNLTETRGYYNVWIALLDESGRLVAHAESGLGKSFLPMVERLKHGQLTACGQRALKQSEAVVTKDPLSTCTDCPLSSSYAGRSAATARLEYEGKVYGFLSVSAPGETATDVEELSLLHEVATDIAFGLHDIELEEERKQAEEALRESEEFNFSLLSNSPNPILVINPDASVRYVNPALEELTGFSSSELVGTKAPYPWWTEETLQKISEDFREAMRKGVQKLEELFQKKDGERFWIEVSATPMKQNGGLKHYVANWVDITERKWVEETLRESEEFNSSLLSNSPNPILVINPDTSVRYVNPALEKLTGFSSSELVGAKPPYPWWTEETSQKIAEDLREGMHKGTSKIEELFQKKDGEQFWAETTGTPAKQNGELRYYLVNWVDITERKRAEEGIKYQRKYFQALFDNSPEAVLSVDMQNRVIDINPAFEKTFGYILKDMAGKDLLDYLVPESKQDEGRNILATTQQGEVITLETIRRRADGREIPVSMLTAPIMLDGKQRGTFAIYRDITERKRATAQLERSFTDLAETVSRAISSRDPYTADHQRKVAELARLVGKKMGLDKHRLEGLYIGALLHDIGKISTPESILSKPGKLTEEEWALIRAHTKQGYEILNGGRFPWPVADMAVHHHERLDGSGYPHGISGDKLSLEVRVLGVCDVVEAMSSHRPYRPARSKEETLEEIKSGRGTKYDADVVDIMLQIIESGEFEFGWR